MTSEHTEAWTQEKIDERLEALEKKGRPHIRRGDVPIGGIILWHGTVLRIPEGYRLCDGTLGTPDLRGKFILGAGGAYDPDDTGGSNSHGHSDFLTHTVTSNHDGSIHTFNGNHNLGAAFSDHSFSFNHTGGAGTSDHSFAVNHTGGVGTSDHSMNNPGNHTHEAQTYVTVQAWGSGDQIFAWDFGNGGAFAETSAEGNHTHTLTNHAAHTITNHTAHLITNHTSHSVDGHTAHDVSAHTAHAAVADNSMPPYYALCYIKRVG